MRDDGCDPSQDVHASAARGTAVVVHHNHLSQQSLSFPDWQGLCNIFSETFAHCADGTIYWGKVVSRPDVVRVLSKSSSVELDATNALFAQLWHRSDAAVVAEFFRKEVANRAMRTRGFVDYQHVWGTDAAIPYARTGQPALGTSAGLLGNMIDQQIDRAAQVIAPTL